MADVSRVEYNEETLIDLTNDTVTPMTLKSGITAHNAAGDLIVGVGGELNNVDIDDDAGIGDLDKVWSADKTYRSIDEVRELADSLSDEFDIKANINSPIFTGEPKAPTPEMSDNSTKLATTEYVNNKINNTLPESIIDDTAGDSVTNKVWSADKTYDAIRAAVQEATISQIGISVAGAWSNSVAYNKLAIVTNSGSSYIAINNVPAGTELSNNNYWLKIAESGGASDIDDSTGIGDTTKVYSSDRNMTIIGGTVIANKVLKNGKYTITEDDIERGSWENEVKTSNTKILRTKYMIPVTEGTIVYITNFTHESRIYLSKYPNSSLNTDDTEWLTESDGRETFIYNVPQDGYIKAVFRKTGGTDTITVSNYDSNITIVAPNRDHEFLFGNFRYKKTGNTFTSESTNNAVSTSLSKLPMGIYTAEVADGYYMGVASTNGSTSSVKGITTIEIKKVNIIVKSGIKYSFAITKNDASEITVEEAKNAFIFRRMPLDVPKYTEYNGAKTADIKIVKCFPFSTSSFDGITVMSDGYYVTDIFKMPDSGISVSTNRINSRFIVSFYKIVNGNIELATDYEYSGKNYSLNPVKGPYYNNETRYYPYKDNLYFSISIGGSTVNHAEYHEDALHVWFGKVKSGIEGRLPNLSLCGANYGTIPGTEITGTYPLLGQFNQTYCGTVIRMSDAKSISCSADYMMHAFFYDEKNQFLGSSCPDNTTEIVRGLNYIDFSSHDKKGYTIILIRKCKTVKMPVDGDTDIQWNESLLGVLRGYDEIYENVYVEYNKNINIQHATGMHPIIAHNIRALKSIIFPKRFAFNYANGHSVNYRRPLLEETNLTPTLYGGRAYCGSFLCDVSVKSFATALQNFNSEIYKSDWISSGSIWDSYGFVCNTNVSAMHGYEWQTSIGHFLFTEDDEVLGMKVIRNWDINTDYDKLSPGDWLVGYDPDNNDGHFILCTDIVYINGEIFSVEILESSYVERYVTYFVSPPCKNIKNLQPETGRKYRTIVKPNYSNLRRLEDAYGDLSSDYTVGTLMCNRGTDSVYGYSDAHCYITVDDPDMQSFQIYKDSALLYTYTIPASNSNDWVSFGDHPLKAVDIISILRAGGSGYYTLIPNNKNTVQESFYFAPINKITLEEIENGTKVRLTPTNPNDVAWVNGYLSGKLTAYTVDDFVDGHLDIPKEFIGRTFSTVIVIYKVQYDNRRLGTYFVMKTLGNNYQYNSTDRMLDRDAKIYD